MSQFYDTDSPDSPKLLDEYKGLKPGDYVLYQNPSWQQPDGSYKTGGMDPPLIITEIIQLGPEQNPLGLIEGFVQAILNEGQWEVNADNLVKEPIVTKTGRVLTDEDIQALADEAERGYDPEKIKRSDRRPR